MSLPRMVSGSVDVMELGAFSVSLAVSNLKESREFYERLGFSAVGGDADQGWLILRNGDTTLGLFQGMFESNMLTFNPGWNQAGEETQSFTDVRDIQSGLQSDGVALLSEVETKVGPGSFMLTDPDGNVILFDQHR